MEKKYQEIIKIAGIYMAINIGAGFTSGQEILQFFSIFGWYGYLTGIITFIIMVYGGDSIIQAGYYCKNNTTISVYEYFGGSVIGQFYNILTPILLYGSYIIMISGAGAVLEQFFHIPNFIGRLIVVFLSIVSIFFNFQLVAGFISKLGKGIAIVIFIIAVFAIFKSNVQNIWKVTSWIQELEIIKGSDTFYGAGILYGSMIVFVSSQFLFDLGINTENRLNAYHGIVWGSLGFIIVALVIHTAIILYLNEVYRLPIVTLYFASLISPFSAFVISLLLFVAMYSSSTICLWSVSNIFKKKVSYWKKRYVAVICCLGIGGMVFSFVSFEKLINILYPISGLVGLCLIILIAIKHKKTSTQDIQE